MKLNKKLKRKIWKYFLQQKAMEILKGIWYFFILCLSIIIASFIGYGLLWLVMYLLKWLCNTLPLMVEIIGFSVMIIIFIFGLFAVYKVFIEDWLKSNWKSAKRRALKEC
jgi:predicted PurR-regulated permease PerM